MRLSKWQGLGNDYLIVEESALPGELTSSAIALLCDRNFGIGADGILLKCPPSGAVEGAVARMRVFNPDGSEPEMCGNGVRMFARYLAARGGVNEEEFVVETLAGAIRPHLIGQRDVRVDMGLARFNSPNILAGALPALRSESNVGAEVVDAELEALGSKYRFTFVDVGNPHCVIPVDDPASFDVERVGSAVERHELFPNRTNVQFVAVERDGSARMRVWERGVGETKASGTGATAVGAALIRLGKVASPVLVRLRGGDLVIEAEPSKTEDERGCLRVHMSGPAEEVFTAELADDLLDRIGWRQGQA